MTFGFGHVLSLGVLENRMAQSGMVFIQCSAWLVVVLACHTAPLPVNHGNILNCHYSSQAQLSEQAGVLQTSNVLFTSVTAELNSDYLHLPGGSPVMGVELWCLASLLVQWAGVCMAWPMSNQN